MEALKKGAIGLLILAVLFVIIGLSLPKETIVKRSIIINAPLDVVFKNVNNLKNHEKWDPWQATDKTMKITYGAVTEGTGASYSWTSESGEGTHTITESMTNKSIKVELDFKKQRTMRGWWTFTGKDKGVLATEGFVNKSGKCFCSRYINLFIDAEIGKYFSKGLKKLKEVSEQAK